MWQPNDEFMTPNAPTGGVAPLRHDLARDIHIQKLKARRETSQQIRVTPFLAAIAYTFFAADIAANADTNTRQAKTETPTPAKAASLFANLRNFAASIIRSQHARTA